MLADSELKEKYNIQNFISQEESSDKDDNLDSEDD